MTNEYHILNTHTVSIGAGIFSNYRYITFNIARITLQFAIEPNDNVFYRNKYGNNDWTIWKVV